jgi:serine/threonine protein kinase
MTEPTLPEESLFLQAIELGSAEEQAAFLDRECGTNAELRSSVEALLRHHRQGSGFLESPPTEVVAAGEQLTAGQADASALDFLAPSAEPASIGRLGHYEILEVLGTGGFGIVTKARDAKLDRIVAVKTLARSLASSPTARRRFVREAKAAAAVKHENVVGIYHVSDDGPVPYLVMECVSGVSLEEKLQEAGMLDLPAILRIGMQVASGLAAAHQQGLVHRDVKPGNILLENGVERVKITDFGLARAANDAAVTRTGDVAGTPQYMSPEQARGDAVDARSDLFSLGSVLYAMCTGRSPFRAETTIAALRRVCDDTPRPIRETNPEIPAWLVEIIDRLLAKKPDERFQTAAEVADLLGQHLAELQHPTLSTSAERTRPPSQIRNPKSQIRRHVWSIAAAALGLLVIGASLTEATGVTKFVPTVIRIVTGEGTLVVETDPDVQVTLEGNGDLTFNLAGGQSIRVPTGSYRVKATKDGKPIPLEKDLVTIARGRQQFVRVRLERAPIVAAAPKEETGAFVVLTGKGDEVRKFDTLAEAVQGASDGDTIEIRGNGPFVSEPITIRNQALAIRAGAGFRPVIIRAERPTRDDPLLQTNASLVLEGLVFQQPDLKDSAQRNLVVCRGASIQAAHCRFLVPPVGTCIIAEDSPVAIARNCEFLGGMHGAIGGLRLPAGARRVMENCVVGGSCAVSLSFWQSDARDISVQLAHNTIVTETHPAVDFCLEESAKVPAPKQTRQPVSIESSANIFHSNNNMWFRQYKANALEPDKAEAALRQLIDWRERQNLSHLGGVYLVWIIAGESHSTERFKTLAEWHRLWGQTATGSLEGRVRFQGGDLFTKLASVPEQLTPDDFRLRADSAGYRAGADGKDLGADVDLVGPGAAYERWKKTPEYQQWLKETGQKK